MYLCCEPKGEREYTKFVEERNNQFSTNYLFNAKKLDNETGLYYYGASCLDPTGAMWLSVDAMWAFIIYLEEMKMVLRAFLLLLEAMLV